jgi:hypothetical protein
MAFKLTDLFFHGLQLPSRFFYVSNGSPQFIQQPFDQIDVLLNSQLWPLILT